MEDWFSVVALRHWYFTG